jgi:molybdopterin converting factor small subunit
MSSGGEDSQAPVEITVRLTGPLRSLAGQSAIDLALPRGATLRDALAALASVVPASFAEQVVQPLARGEATLPVLLLNRTCVSSPAELDRAVSQGDVVALVTAMDGG